LAVSATMQVVGMVGGGLSPLARGGDCGGSFLVRAMQVWASGLRRGQPGVIATRFAACRGRDPANDSRYFFALEWGGHDGDGSKVILTTSSWCAPPCALPTSRRQFFFFFFIFIVFFVWFWLFGGACVAFCWGFFFFFCFFFFFLFFLFFFFLFFFFFFVGQTTRLRAWTSLACS